MSYTMRPLKTSDVYQMSKILKKLNIKTNELLKNIDIKKIKISKDTTEIGKMAMLQAGIELIQKVLENLHLAENEVNEFLAGLVGITGKEFGELPIEDTLEIITLFKEQKGLANFLKLAGK
jgi:hypothetical protein